MNTDNLLVAVSGYSGDKFQLENNISLYTHHGATVLILSPADAPITEVSDPRVHCQWIGEKGWAGPQTLVRHKLFLERLLTFDKEWFLFHDADSVCLSPTLPQYLFRERASWSNEVADLNTGTSYLRKIACQPPYFFHREVLTAIHRVAESKTWPTSYYGEITGDPIVTECIDHFHMQLAAGSSYPMKSFPDGCSWETTSEHGLNTMIEHVRMGKILVHQVKHEHVRDRLVSEHARLL